MHQHHTRLATAIGYALLAGSAMALALPAFASGTPAAASSTNPQAQTAPATTSQNTTATNKKKSKKQAQNAQQLSSIVVTAQSRSQRLEVVPITDHVITADDIKIHTASNLSQMDAFIPGLVVSAGEPTQPSYQLRGIGGSGFGIGTDSAVGVYIDGVYSARTGSALLAFNDVKRIEVLKGPQGTLFGRNAAAGAISIITNRPDPTRVQVKANLRLGNYGERYFSGLLNLPTGKNSAFRFSVYDNQSDGWIYNHANGSHSGKNDDWGVRASFLVNLASTQFWFTADHERLKQPHRPHVGLVKMTGDTHTRPPFPADPSTYLNPLTAPLYNDAVGDGETRRYNDATLHISHFMDWGTFSSITSWRQFNTFDRGDWDGTDHIVTYLDETNIEYNRSLYQEFKLQGSNSLINWVVGASWYKEDAIQHNQINLYTDSIDTLAINLNEPTGTPPGTGPYGYFSSLLALIGRPVTLLGDPWREDMVNHLRDTSTAVYGDVIWHLTDKLDLTTGARFTRDIKHFTWINTPRQAVKLDQTIDGLSALLALAGVSASEFRQNIEFTQSIGVPFPLSHTWNDFSPRIVLTDHFTDNLMAYASVTKGYKAGGFNSLKVNSTFAPEKVWNYEIGFKGVFPNAHLVLNTSLYHYKYSNLQQLVLQTTSSTTVPRYTTQSSDEKATGVDFEMQWRPTSALAFTMTGAYIDSTFEDKIGVSGADLSGEPTGVPLFSGALGMQYTWHLGASQLALNLNYGFRGATRCNGDSQTQGVCRVSPNFNIGGSINHTDARLAWSAPGNKWGVALYGNNVFNHRHVIKVDQTTAAVFGTPFADISPPRTYGIEFSMNL